MERIQKLFERIAGIPQECRSRGELTLTTLASPRVDTAALRIPACWRRKAQVRGVRR